MKTIIFVGSELPSEAAVGFNAVVFPDLRAAIARASADAEGLIYDLRSGNAALGDVRLLRNKLRRCSFIALLDSSTPMRVRAEALRAGLDDMLVVPIGLSASDLAGRIAKQVANIRRRRVLVVDNEADNRDLLKQELFDANFDVLLASDGPTALDLAPSADVMLLDMMMPGMDGREVCQRIRSDQRTRALPVVMVSAQSDARDKLGALNLGANDYVTKPYDSDQLIEKVRRLLWLADAQQQPARRTR